MAVKLIVGTVLLTLIVVAMAAPISVEEEFSNFKVKFNRTYATPEEEQQRFNIFKANFDRIQEHNKKYEAGEVTYTQGINDFADLTREEFKSRHLGLRLPRLPKDHTHSDAS
ncbi:hypothetical protein GWI33_021827 [Rhynchophorus ferrugineus]|uniref:Cathepsin propeptide inhibitor domain-containing protein n=1 Tax=Rhynchophorus ferrugineus TaxID=354439 RepID=A0A834MMV0_RHYFE|nr:hypothetical protein GWI33_021827 [Rhynchophorus ferrugineus]